MTMRNEADEVFLPARSVRQRYGGKSDMWLWRLLRDDPGFCRPTYIRGQRYWRLSALVDWERSCASTTEVA